jgi:hypothetical protein
MKILASLLLLAALGAIVVWEVLWRLDHPLPGDLSAASGGSYVAQQRTLPEGSELPYGQGVFVRHRYVPLWATSKLVFAAYCKPEMALAWPTSDHLAISCVVAEGQVTQFPTPSGITVTHDGGA